MVPHGYLSDTEREGGELDLETIKTKEKEFYKSLKEQVKVCVLQSYAHRIYNDATRITRLFKF